MELNNSLIVMYDGDCGFCCRTVRFVLKNGDDSILFTPLDSNKSSEIFKEQGITDPDKETFYFCEKGLLFERSKAAFHLSAYLRYPYKAMIVFKWIPAVFTDPFYNLIARNRKKLAREGCLLPTLDERKRFI